MDGRLVAFLKERAIEKGQPFTHTSKIAPRGCYNIVDDDLNDFYEIYNQVIMEGKVAGITEKVTPVLPMIVDVDFRYNVDNGVKRYYKSTHIQNVIEIYHKIMEEIIENPKDEMFTCIVLEKSAPTRVGSVFKDGFHLHFPFFFTEIDTQRLYIRTQVIARVAESKIFQDIPLLESLEKVFDKNIPSQGLTWLMYGSRKEPQLEPYKMTKRYNRQLESIQLKNVFKRIGEDSHEYNLPVYLSIRTDEPPTALKPEIQQLIAKPTSNKRKRIQVEYIRSLEDIFREITEEVDPLMEMLDNSRADDYHEWYNIGQILYSISEGHEKGLDRWITFSKRSDKFEEGACEAKWQQMSVGTHTTAILKHLARIDAPNEYMAFKNHKLDSIFEQGVVATHGAVARVLHILYENQFVCADVEKKQWFEFVGHRWVRSPAGIGLRKKLGTEIKSRYMKFASKYAVAASDESLSDTQKKNNTVLCKQTTDLAMKLENAPFKNNIMVEAAELFYDPKFVELMDENKDLIVFENGVYDNRQKAFRNGRPGDYCTKTTHHRYVEFEDHDPRVVEMVEMIRKILPDEHLFRFFRHTSSAIIKGGNPHKKFLIWSGQGDNGKSVLSELFEKALGDYFYTPPTTLLTGKQNQASGATSELLPCKGARLVVVSETDNNDILNCGTMKKLTGGDPFYARGNYRDPIKITPMFSLLMHCNKKPGVSAEDKASWNRIVILQFGSSFVQKSIAPTSTDEQWARRIFPMDSTLKERLYEMSQIFIWWLIKEYESFADQELYVPACVVEATNMYRKNNDFYLQYMDEHIQQSNPSDYILCRELYDHFKQWYKRGYPGKIPPDRVCFQEALEKKLGKTTRGKWKGFTMYDPDDDNDSQTTQQQQLSTFDKQLLANANAHTLVPTL